MKVLYCEKSHKYGTIEVVDGVIHMYTFRSSSTSEQNQVRFKRCLEYLSKYRNAVLYPHPLFDSIIKKSKFECEQLTHKNCSLAEYIEKVMLTIPQWSELFRTVMTNDDVMSNLTELNKVIQKNKVYPRLEHVFNAFILTPELPKVVIIGQDPYHNKGAAMGLAFGHHRDYPTIQPSLRNIFKELESCGYTCGENGDLTKWAQQGVFLINTALTVNEGQPESHLKYWQPFVRLLFSYLSRKCDNLVVVMWGRKAQNFSNVFDSNKHYFIKSAHPSPFSVKNFFGTKPFTKVNNQLRLNKEKEIDWNL